MKEGNADSGSSGRRKCGREGWQVGGMKCRVEGRVSGLKEGNAELGNLEGRNAEKGGLVGWGRECRIRELWREGMLSRRKG